MSLTDDTYRCALIPDMGLLLYGNKRVGLHLTGFKLFGYFSKNAC